MTKRKLISAYISISLHTLNSGLIPTYLMIIPNDITN